MRKIQKIAVFFGTIAAVLLVTVSVFLLNGCSKKTIKTEPAKTESVTKVEKDSGIKVEEEMNGGRFQVYAEKNGGFVALYSCRFDAPIVGQGVGCYHGLLMYKNKRGENVSVFVDETVECWDYDGSVDGPYFCKEQKNAESCRRVTEKVNEWKAVLKWPERVKRVIEKSKADNPEEHIN